MFGCKSILYSVEFVDGRYDSIRGAGKTHRQDGDNDRYDGQGHRLRLARYLKYIKSARVSELHNIDYCKEVQCCVGCCGTTTQPGHKFSLTLYVEPAGPSAAHLTRSPCIGVGPWQ